MSDVVRVERFVVEDEDEFVARLEAAGWQSFDDILGGECGDSEAVVGAGDERAPGVSEDSEGCSGGVSSGGGG